MRNASLLGARLVLGGYLAAHGAQKLFGSFGGPGLDAVSQGFDGLGLTPGRQMATLASAAEIGGGLLTAAGAAHPLGPVTIASTMAVASATHRQAGPLAANGGYELALTNLAAALALAAAGPGTLRLGPAVPRRVAAAVTVTSAALAAVSIARLVRASRAAATADPAPADGADAAPAEAADEPLAS